MGLTPDVPLIPTVADASAQVQRLASTTYRLLFARDALDNLGEIDRIRWIEIQGALIKER